ncbi:gamma-glutamyltranspeptidase [Mesorhizobium shonense]|uniref:Gamma-glutamyltranspeptidase n=2 Tax=Mesorhizobium shonense TaxID=1209948 RepID=A0ABV2I4V0_9HYPH
MHTIIPAMAVQDGNVSVSFGVMGGAVQPLGHAHVFSNSSIMEWTRKRQSITVANVGTLRCHRDFIEAILQRWRFVAVRWPTLIWLFHFTQ